MISLFIFIQLIFIFFIKPIVKDSPRKKLRRQLYSVTTECHYCSDQLQFENSTLDHKIPESKGGKTDEDNCVICCDKCNQLKGNTDYDEFAKIISSVEERDFYWVLVEKRIISNKKVDIMYPHIKIKIKEYDDIIKEHERSIKKLSIVFGNNHKKIIDLKVKIRNIKKEISKLEYKFRQLKNKILKEESMKQKIQGV